MELLEVVWYFVVWYPAKSLQSCNIYSYLSWTFRTVAVISENCQTRCQIWVLKPWVQISHRMCCKLQRLSFFIRSIEFLIDYWRAVFINDIKISFVITKARGDSIKPVFSLPPIEKPKKSKKWSKMLYGMCTIKHINFPVFPVLASEHNCTFHAVYVFVDVMYDIKTWHKKQLCEMKNIFLYFL